MGDKKAEIMAGNSRRFFLLLLALVVSGLLAGCGANGGTNNNPNTTVSGLTIGTEFQSFYQANGGELLLGPPVSQPFQVGGQGPVIQYFRNIRLDAAPDNSAVTVFAVGDWAQGGAVTFSPVAVPESALTRVFPETGFAVTADFLTFYDANDGAVLLGPPISPIGEEDGIFVQYFRNGRLTFDPNLPPGQQVQLSPLGLAHFQKELFAAYQDTLFAQPLAWTGLTVVDVAAFVLYPTVYAGQSQELYITVRSAQGNPVLEIPVTATLQVDDISRPLDLPVTNDEGQIRAILDLDGIAPGQEVQVLIQIQGSNGAIIGEERVFFHTWW
jgi:hypothetical protein